MMVATWRTSIQPRTARDVTSLLSSKSPFSPARSYHCSSHYVSLERNKKDPCAAGSSLRRSFLYFVWIVLSSVAITCGPFRADYPLGCSPFCAHVTACFSWGPYRLAAPRHLSRLQPDHCKILLQPRVVLVGLKIFLLVVVILDVGHARVIFVRDGRPAGTAGLATGRVKRAATTTHR